MKRIRILLSIGHVDGTSDFTLETDNPTLATQFLHDHDHEGSTLFLRVEVDNEDVPKLLSDVITLAISE